MTQNMEKRPGSSGRFLLRGTETLEELLASAGYSLGF
jgi:hypothetical protein